MKNRGHPEFYKLLEELKELHEKKTNDYSGNKPLKDIREVADLGIEPWKGVVVRMVHKFGRLKQLTRGTKTMCKDETIVDTLMDIAGYALIVIILLREHVKKTKRGLITSGEQNVQSKSTI